MENLKIDLENDAQRLIVQSFIQKGTISERQRILSALEEVEKRSHSTRTPIYQNKLFDIFRDIVNNTHPPIHFRDIGNGE